jgi:hypothetical protein
MPIPLADQGRWLDSAHRDAWMAGDWADRSSWQERAIKAMVVSVAAWPRVPFPSQTMWLWMLLVFVAAVSVHDAALVVLNHEVILHYEQNPVGRWLIEANGGEVWMFAAVKLFCTALVCCLVVRVHEWHGHHGLAVAGGLAGFQALLLIYLCSH